MPIRRPAARSAPSATRTTATRSWRQKEGPLAADAEDAIWQRRGSGFADNPPVQITSDESLSTIVAWTDWLLEIYPGVLVSKPMPHPDALYASDVCSTMPEPVRAARIRPLRAVDAR